MVYVGDTIVSVNGMVSLLDSAVCLASCFPDSAVLQPTPYTAEFVRAVNSKLPGSVVIEYMRDEMCTIDFKVWSDSLIFQENNIEHRCGWREEHHRSGMVRVGLAIYYHSQVHSLDCCWVEGVLLGKQNKRKHGDLSRQGTLKKWWFVG